MSSTSTPTGDASAAVIGAGGNIGSHLVAHLARMPEVTRIVLVDPDIYEAKNLVSQDIVPRDVGKPKALVQARRLRRINPTLIVTPIVDAVENAPMGLFAGSVLLSCLDSRASRRTVNLVASRLGLRWIDAGVLNDGLLARVNTYFPGADEPCLECGWEDRDYELLEQQYPCAWEPTASRATNAPSALGALAASLQHLEYRKLLGGDVEHVAVGKQVTITALSHRLYVTRIPRNAACRTAHAKWELEALASRPEKLTVRRLFELGRASLGGNEALSLQVAQQVFAKALVCPGCGARLQTSLRLLGRLDAVSRTCGGCGGGMRAAGYDLIEWLPEDEIPAGVRAAALSNLGIRRGDVVTVVAGSAAGNAAGDRAVHFQIGRVERNVRTGAELGERMGATG